MAYLAQVDELSEHAVPEDIDVLHTVHGSGPDDRLSLGEALGWINGGPAQALLVCRLGSVAASLGEVVRLLDWLAQREASLIALDLGLDTDQPAGRMMANVLREIQRWSREPHHPRRPAGRPGLLRGSPELAEYIAEMRRNGLSLHAIADALNDEGIPTPRGGARWRASSVQTALGYQRPRPPAPPDPPPGRGPGGAAGAGRHPRPRPGPKPGRPR